MLHLPLFGKFLASNFICFNLHCSNAVKIFYLPKYRNWYTLHLKMNNHPVLKAILKYMEHASPLTSLIAITFSIFRLLEKIILKEITSLNIDKTPQETAIPVYLFTSSPKENMLNIVLNLLALN